MTKLNISNSNVSEMHNDSYNNALSGTDFYSGNLKQTDGATGSETTFLSDFNRWHGYYHDVPIFAAAIDIIAAWVIGEGFIPADEKNKKKTETITGFGKDDFDSIIENCIRVMLVGGDSMAEEIRDKARRLTNLKPLNPASINIIANDAGILSRYEQFIAVEKDGKTELQKVGEFDTKEIFHLCWNRLADEIHGKPYAERVEPIIVQIKQLTEDLGLRFHRIVKPLRLFESDTDDPAKIEEETEKLKTAYKNAEVVVIPKGTLEAKDGAAIPNAEDAIKFLNVLLREFVTAIGVPEVVMGWGEATSEATSKVVTLNFETKIKNIQKFVANQIKSQLGIEGKFEVAATLEPAMTQSGMQDKGIETPKVNSPSSDMAKRGKQITKK